MPGRPSRYHLMREHRHRHAGGAADLDGMGVGRPETEMFGEHGGQHQMRHGGGVAAQQAIDVAAPKPGIGQRQFGRLAHQTERRRALEPAESRQSDARDKTHAIQLIAGALAYFAGSSSET